MTNSSYPVPPLGAGLAANDRLHGATLELRSANLDLTQIVEGTDRPTLVVDRDLTIVRVNAPLCSAFRLDPPVAGASLGILTRRFADEAAMTREISEVVGTGAWSQRQVCTVEGRWYLMRAFPFSAGAEPAGAVVTLNDIDSAKTVEARFQLAMSAGRFVWWDWDFATGVIAVYGGVPCIFGYTLETLPRTQREWLERTHPEDLAAVSAAMQACIEGQAASWSLVHRLRAADGSWRWVHNCGRPAECDERGVPQRMLGVTRDVHEAHEATLTVRRDAQILAQLQDAVVTSDAAGRILSVNDAYERIFGWKKAEAVGRHAFFRLPEPARAEAQRLLDRMLAGEHVELDWEDYRQDNSRVWIHWRARPLLDEQGRIIGTISVGTDITEKKAAADRQKQLQEQLFHAQKMDTLGTLAGGIAHDLNNMLAVIFGYSELARVRAADNAEVQHFHEEIVKAGVRGRDLVKRILSFSRFEEPQRRPVQLSEVMADAVKFMRATLPSTVQVEFEIAGGLPAVLADPDQLSQVLLNLATNASHAMDHRGRFSLRVAAIDFRATQAVATGQLEAGAYFVIEAADTGHGIHADVLGRIFDPFFTTKKEGEGTGLGLSVVRAIVEGHGGRIDVQSQPGRGARFLIYLPRVAAAAGAVSKPAVAPALPRGDGRTVVVIDDEEMVSASTVTGLQRLGYETVSYDSASRFWPLFSAAPHGIDAIVTDQTMPGMTGMELVRRLREEGHDLPVLVVTGFSTHASPETVKQFRNLAFLRKPYGQRELAEALDGLLAPKGRPESPSPRAV